MSSSSDRPEAPNLYAAPSATDLARGEADPTGDMPLLRRWERLRVLYNAILAGVVLLAVVATPSLVGERVFRAFLVRGCIGANLCFCAGPILNAYACWIGLRGRAVTTVLFVAGTLLAVLIAFGALFAFSLRGLD